MPVGWRSRRLTVHGPQQPCSEIIQGMGCMSQGRQFALLSERLAGLTCNGTGGEG